MSAERRNRWGLPRMFANIVTRPGATATTKLVQVFNSALPWVVILATFACLALGMSISHESRMNDLASRYADAVSQMARQREDFSWKIDELKKAADSKEREIRMLEYYVVETDQKLVAKGALKQSETWSASKGKK